MDLKQKLLAKIDSLEPAIREVSRFIHAHPEEGFKEKFCSRFLMERFKRQGFRVERPVKSLPTAFRASRGQRNGPAVGFIAEYDCLPGIGHGCGHNLISASAFGAAAALAPFLKETGGSVQVFGTPAEEFGSAKIPMLKAGVFKAADAILMMHPESFWLVNTGCLALDALAFEFRGRSSHAASTPHEGINALDAMIQFYNGVNAMRQQLKGDVRVHGIITKGGSAPNIIPDLTEAQFYVRALKREELDVVTPKIKACAYGAALATGCRLKITEFEPSLDDTVHIPVLDALVDRSLRTVGVKDIGDFDPVPGSADIGNLSHRVPTAYFYGAIAPRGMDLHTAQFARQAKTEQAHRGLMTSIKALALAGLELLENPRLVKQARLTLKH